MTATIQSAQHFLFQNEWLMNNPLTSFFPPKWQSIHDNELLQRHWQWEDPATHLFLATVYVFYLQVVYLPYSFLHRYFTLVQVPTASQIGRWLYIQTAPRKAYREFVLITLDYHSDHQKLYKLTILCTHLKWHILTPSLISLLDMTCMLKTIIK